MAVDTAEGVISHVQADFADGRDSQSLPDITLKLQQRLSHNELRLEELLADTGYSNGGNYALLEQWNIMGWIPVFGQYKPQIESFPYDSEADHFTCSQDKRLLFRTYDRNADGGWLRVYRVDIRTANSVRSNRRVSPRVNANKLFGRPTIRFIVELWNDNKADGANV